MTGGPEDALNNSVMPEKRARRIVIGGLPHVVHIYIAVHVFVLPTNHVLSLLYNVLPRIREMTTCFLFLGQ